MTDALALLAEEAPPKQIPYGFARRNGVVIAQDEGDNITIAIREGANLRILMEVKRHLSRCRC